MIFRPSSTESISTFSRALSGTTKFVLIFVLMLCSTQAYSIMAQAATSSFIFPDQTLRGRLEQINKYGKETDQVVTYEFSQIPSDVQVKALTTKSNNMEEWLYYSLRETPFTYHKLDGRYFSVVRRAEPKAAVSVAPVEQSTRKGTLSGHVVDENGEELPGATISVPAVKQGAITGIRGEFGLSLPAGKYTVEVSFIGYDTQRITDVVIKAGQTTPLSIVLTPASTQLGGVVVTANYNRNNTEGALKIQQTMPQLSTVMSVEQISKTSDKNLGETLKRITGVSTLDNKYVSIRGMGERWNEASLDGIILPSTETNNKAFSFDIIPTNIIESVTVIKTATPDLNANFAGGLIQVRTKDIPDENFFNVQLGTSLNDESTGKTQYHRARGAWDWLGFDDGRRKFPTELQPFGPTASKDEQDAQTFKFRKMGDNLSLYSSKTPLSWNGQLSFGKSYKLDSGSADKAGFIFSLSYRNTQQQTPIEAYERGNYLKDISRTDSKGNILPPDQQRFYSPIFLHSATGANYKYGVVLSGLLNAGWQFGSNRLSLRNTYTHKHDNNLLFLSGMSDYYGFSFGMSPDQRHTNFPTFQDLVQNKLEGQHRFGELKLDWNLAHTYIHRNQTDVAKTEKYSHVVDNTLFWNNFNVLATQRSRYDNKERDWNWGFSLEMPFQFSDNFKSKATMGYSGNHKYSTFLFNELDFQRYDEIGKTSTLPEEYRNLPYQTQIDPDIMARYGFVWRLRGFMRSESEYQGRVDQHSPFVMLNHQISDWLRVVWGIRADYYNYNEISSPVSERPQYLLRELPAEKKWSWLPSINMTFTPIKDFNIRLAYSRSIIRPQFTERTNVQMYEPLLGGYLVGLGVQSSKVDGYDLRLEWYPSPGEVLAVGGFYRHIDKPIERTAITMSAVNHFFFLENSNWAKNYGLELEWRKNFAFIHDAMFLHDLYLYGNASFIWSKVQAFKREQQGGEVGSEKITEKLTPYDYTRPLYGQTPYMYNVGLSYEGEQWGANLAYNAKGRTLMSVNSSPWLTEYEASRGQLDAQVSYTIPSAGLTFKLNGSNLTNAKTVYYLKAQSNYEEVEVGGILGKLKAGTNENYKPGEDQVTYQYRSGRTFSFSITWKL